ncbi:MAG: hypothetical protein D6710_10240 [Nitrospirae bacterium]|nr:MAG: hypothetical protein D6710_10240 [Nitrospirota bacterium]
MSIQGLDVIDILDNEDKEKVAYFVSLLIEKKKYRNLLKELKARRAEIKKGQSFSHSEIWEKLDV